MRCLSALRTTSGPTSFFAFSRLENPSRILPSSEKKPSTTSFSGTNNTHMSYQDFYFQGWLEDQAALSTTKFECEDCKRVLKLRERVQGTHTCLTCEEKNPRLPWTNPLTPGIIHTWKTTMNNRSFRKAIYMVGENRHRGTQRPRASLSGVHPLDGS